MVDFSGINYWAVFVALVINLVVGSFWYSPAGFGKRWSKLSGSDLMKMPKDKANQAILYVAASSIVQVVILAAVLKSLHVDTSSNPTLHGLVAGVLLWLGFVGATTVGNNFYMRKGWSFWWINSSFFLVVMAVNSVILAVWK